MALNFTVANPRSIGTAPFEQSVYGLGRELEREIEKARLKASTTIFSHADAKLGVTTRAYFILV